MVPGLLPALAVALAGALAVGPVVFVTVLMASRHGRLAGVSFQFGYVASHLLIGVALVVTGVDPAAWSSGAYGPVGPWIVFGVGVGMIMVSLSPLARRSRGLVERLMPSSLSLLDRVTPLRALVVGFVSSVANFKNAALLVASVALLQAGGGTLAGRLAAVTAVALTFALPGFVPLTVGLLFRKRSDRALVRIRAWSERVGPKVVRVIVVAAGTGLALRGATALFGP